MFGVQLLVDDDGSNTTDLLVNQSPPLTTLVDNYYAIRTIRTIMDG